MDYQFTNNWFQANAQPVWGQLIPMTAPRRVLEVGSYEGASACYILDNVQAELEIELHCIDTWEGGIESRAGGVAETDMSAVETRFKSNIDLARSRRAGVTNIVIHKMESVSALAKLLTDGCADYFDFAYIDGSHQACDVLTDAVLTFRLLRPGGTLVFDDYLWSERLPGGVDPIRSPKIAIDAFTTIFCRKIQIFRAPLYQMYMRKIAN